MPKIIMQMKTQQLTLFPMQPKSSISIFKALDKSWLDNLFCYIGKSFCAIITMLGLVVILSGEISEARREDKIEELAYRRNEEDDILKENTPDFTDLQRRLLSKNHKRWIIRDGIRKRMQRNSTWAKQIDNALTAMKQ